MRNTANSERHARIGVGIVSSGDGVALGATVAALQTLRGAIHQMLIVEPVERPVPRRCAGTPGMRTIGARFYENAHAMVLADMAAGVDLILVLREGLVLNPEFIDDVRRVFAERPGLAACIFRTDRTLMGRTDGPADSADRDAFDVGRRSRWASRYSAPSILCVVASSAAADAFETFGRRSDWASYRIYADTVTARGLVASEVTSEHFYALLDRAAQAPRGPDGRRTYHDLNRLADAHVRYRPIVRQDLLTIMIEQVASILRGSEIPSRLSFLSGVASEARADARLRKRIRRDIAALG